MWWKNVKLCNKCNLASTVSTLWKNKALLPALHNKLTMNKKMKFSNVLQAVLDWFKACKGADFPANGPICKMAGAWKFHMQQQMMLPF
jgi:hypothetical protein